MVCACGWPVQGAFAASSIVHENRLQQNTPRVQSKSDNGRMDEPQLWPLHDHIWKQYIIQYCILISYIASEFQLGRKRRNAPPSCVPLSEVSIMDFKIATPYKQRRIESTPGEVICLIWLGSGAAAQYPVASNRSRQRAETNLISVKGNPPPPLHSGSLALSRWSQNKASQSNHEKRWVGRAGDRGWAGH